MSTFSYHVVPNPSEFITIPTLQLTCNLASDYLVYQNFSDNVHQLFSSIDVSGCVLNEHTLTINATGIGIFNGYTTNVVPPIVPHDTSSNLLLTSSTSIFGDNFSNTFSDKIITVKEKSGVYTLNVQDNLQLPCYSTNQNFPTQASDVNSPITYGTGTIHVDVYQDFQCPACRFFELNYMPVLFQAALNNNITLAILPSLNDDDYYPYVSSLPPNPNNDSPYITLQGSLKAAMAWATVSDLDNQIGKINFTAYDGTVYQWPPSMAYHHQLFVNQPTEGAYDSSGWTDQLLIKTLTDIGITSSTYSDSYTYFINNYQTKYSTWAYNVYNIYVLFYGKTFYGTTPGFIVNYQIVPFEVNGYVDFFKAVNNATSQRIFNL